MRVKLEDVKKIIREELESLDEVGAVAPVPLMARRGRLFGKGAPEEQDLKAGQKTSHTFTAPSDADLDAPDAVNIDRSKIPQPANTPKLRARKALNRSLKALKSFNPKLNSMFCPKAVAEEMPSLISNLEKNLTTVGRMINESKDAQKDQLDEAGSFLGQFSVGGGRRMPRLGKRAEEEAPLPDVSDFGKGGKLMWTLPKVRRAITDFLAVYDTFTPAWRRNLCLGKEGAELANALQELDKAFDDMLSE